MQALIGTVEELNKQFPASRQLPLSVDVALTGPSGSLDSLGLINFIVMAEQKLEEEFGTTVSLTDDTILAHSQEVFHNIQTLSDHLSRRLCEMQHD